MYGGGWRGMMLGTTLLAMPYPLRVVIGLQLSIKQSKTVEGSLAYNDHRFDKDLGRFGAAIFFCKRGMWD
jgi:hypothetical protein